LEAGSWNDLTNTGDSGGNYQPKGYIVEYGGTNDDPVLKIAASTITIAQITNIVSSDVVQEYHSSSNCRRRNNTLILPQEEHS
jgi:hypothetical protein